MKKIKAPRSIPGSGSLPGMAARSAGKQAMWSVIPPQAYLLMVIPAMGCAGGLFYLAGYAWRGGKTGGLWGLVIGGVVLAVAGLIYLGVRWLRKRRERRRAAAFEGNLKAEAAKGGGVIADPGEAARVDEMRQKFQRGIDVFRQYGKSVYDFPWYVMVGEPGAGKTEAIRHSSIPFPEGLQEKQQGVGGTYSMDWWFTDRAILLDTAGALLTEADSAARFEEFLKMLKAHRPDCPINGMIVAVSVESLLLDDVEETDRKGLNLARQLTMIQKALGLRFGIYLMITKSDLIPGFKEFCDAPANAAYERQLFGWSNPHDLDVSVRSAEVCAQLEQMVTRLRYRRWAVMQDPVPRERDGRRIDEVDALFAFPDALSQVVRRLGRYLDIVFSDSEWSEMPPFFRGVYFTSSKREGAALDRQLAQALQIPANKLPEGGVWVREKSLYLRELFLGKIFREKGLVTRTRDLGSLLRRRLVFYYVITACLLVGFLGMGFLFYRGIVKQIRIETPQFRYAHSKFVNGMFAPIVKRDPEGKWQHNVVEQQQLFQEAAPLRPLPGFAFFRPLEAFYREDLVERRPRSHEVVVAGSVIKPLLDGVRERLAETPPGTLVDEPEMKALLALMKVKAAVGGKEGAMADPVEDFLWPLLRYVLDPEAPAVSRTDLEDAGAFLRGYSWSEEWWMLHDELGAFRQGFDRLLLKRESEGARQAEQEAAVARFRELETELLAAETLPEDVELRLRELGTVKEKLDALTGALRFGEAGHRETWQAMLEVSKLLPGDGEFQSLRRELEGGSVLPSASLGNVITGENEGGETGDRDPRVDPYLGITEASQGPLYAYRYRQYQEMLEPTPTEVPDLIGKMSETLEGLASKRKSAPTYHGEMGERFTRLCEKLAMVGEGKARAALLEHWRLDVGGLARASARFPFVKETGNPIPAAQFPPFAERWGAVSEDLPVVEEAAATGSLALRDAVKVAGNLTSLVDILWNAEDGQMAMVTVTGVSAGKLETGRVPAVPVPAEDGGVPPARALPETRTEYRGLDYCEVIDDNDKTVLAGRLAEDPAGKAMALDGGFRVLYNGWREFSSAEAEKDEGRFTAFAGEWGLLKALQGSVSRPGAEQSVVVPTPEFPQANLRLHFRFSSGRFDASHWVTGAELGAAFNH